MSKHNQGFRIVSLCEHGHDAAECSKCAAFCEHGINYDEECAECEANREPGHQSGCICVDCSGGEITADND